MLNRPENTVSCPAGQSLGGDGWGWAVGAWGGETQVEAPAIGVDLLAVHGSVAVVGYGEGEGLGREVGDWGGEGQGQEEGEEEEQSEGI